MVAHWNILWYMCIFFEKKYTYIKTYFKEMLYMLRKIMVTMLAYQNLNMLLEHLYIFVTLQCWVLMSQMKWFWVQMSVIIKI